MKTTFVQTENKYTDIIVEGWKEPAMFRGAYPQLVWQKVFDYLSLIPKQEKANLTVTVKRGTVGNYVNLNNNK